jgi:hypothetical protein
LRIAYVSDHDLVSVCYTSSGPTSNIEIVAELKCKTSDKAFIKTQISDRVTVRAGVRASDCQLKLMDKSERTDGTFSRMRTARTPSATRQREASSLNGIQKQKIGTG